MKLQKKVYFKENVYLPGVVSFVGLVSEDTVLWLNIFVNSTLTWVVLVILLFYLE